MVGGLVGRCMFTCLKKIVFAMSLVITSQLQSEY